jgi:hypothetical protein
MRTDGGVSYNFFGVHPYSRRLFPFARKGF